VGLEAVISQDNQRWLARLVLAGVLGMMYAPVFMVLAYSFNESRIGSVWTGFSTKWYGELFRRPELWEGLRTSLQIGGLSSTLSVLLGLCAALGLRDWSIRKRRVARGFMMLPLVVPDMIIAVSLALFFHAVGMRQGMLRIVLAHASFGMSYSFVVLAAAVEDFDRTLVEAARDCGATAWQAFCRVTVPILAPSIFVAWLFVFALSFDDFLITFFTKMPGTDTLPIKIYTRIRFGVRPDTNALFVVLFLTTFVGVLVAVAVSRRGQSVQANRR
jgi:ABC-type spermidine/putrescine transport system permease subunit II